MEKIIKDMDDKIFDETLKSTDKLVIVEFYTNTCPNCLAIAPVYEELAKELGKDAIFTQVNAQKNIAIAQRYGVMATPTFKFFCKNGPIGELVGAIHATVLRNTIKDLIRHRTECVSKSTRISYEMDGYG
jgi:thiol-disulfide isomerase/thioredoxin